MCASHSTTRSTAKAAEAGYPQGFDAGDITTDTSFATSGEAAVNYLAAVGIRARIRMLERAALYSQLREKKARPLEAFVAASGLYTYGTYPDIEGLIQEQSVELDWKRREATLHKIQQLLHERAVFAPIYEVAILNGYGPRVAEPGLGLIEGYLFSAPYEDVKLRDK